MGSIDLLTAQAGTRAQATPAAVAVRFPSIADVEHVYFYAATSATPDLVKQYFQQAYQLGRDFERPATGAGQSVSAA
jgi:hypothetical protein